MLPSPHPCPLQSRAARWEGRLYLFFVTLLTLLTSLTAVYTLYHPPPRHPPLPTYHVPLQLSLVFLSLLSFFCCHFTHPGPPSLWSDLRPDLPHPLYPSQPPPAPRYCLPCSAPKPARVHHCRTCNACILRFDHHCVWLATCIGQRNLKFFLLFLLYTTLAATHATYVLLCFMRAIHQPHVHHFSTPRDVLAGAVAAPISLAVSVCAAFGVSCQLAWSMWLAARNETTLEHLVRTTENRADADRGGKELLVYDRGLVSNLMHALGGNPLLWLLPVYGGREGSLKGRWGD
ncbi:unnamed protein product [Chondrus crispus]|uniref:Palmitoyltransferase n=1 Tax=Chondrus crispus TaxID=2769 RepID=R7QDT7_CHOCR|nr:unnamed protein product [Chondrus crispus]CDF35606.1 unnamed protein product [Chondrus crispus]|eukprot:XP_005715425.1 unnamed protein product [Chondrus crispus]